MKSVNQRHWDKLNDNYNKAWETKAKHILSNKELAFINKYLNEAKPKKLLDIGVGTGRIINNLLNNLPIDVEIRGIDISNEMIQVCEERFMKEKRIKELKQVEIIKEKDEINKLGLFDFITAIRVFKYNKEWKEMVRVVSKMLNEDGVFIFTMPNKESLNKFARYPIKFYKTDYKEIIKLLKELNLEVLTIQSFTRIPDVIYDLRILSKSSIYARFLDLIERILGYFLGDYRFGRMFFIACKKLTTQS